MKTLVDVTADTQRRLGDTGAAIWTSDEIKGYIRRGYELLTFRTGMLWTWLTFDRVVSAFTHTQVFEEDYLADLAGAVQSQRAQFTSLFERDWIDNAEGPANHNYFFEFDQGFVTTVYISPLVDLPEELYEIERCTWDNRRIEPMRSREMEQIDGRYELTQGMVQAYVANKDGLRKIRLWRVPDTSSVSDNYQYDSDSSTWGILRRITPVNSSSVTGTWGDLVSIPGEDVTGGPWGIIRRITKNIRNLKIEYRRRGSAIQTDDATFDIPDRYVTYVRWFALAEALGRDGDGRDVKLSEHYKQRYEAGIARIKRRMELIQTQRKTVLKGSRRTPLAPGKATLPWQYGKVVR